MSMWIQPLSFALIMGTAYVLKRVKVVQASDSKLIAKLVLNVTLPMAVLRAFASLENGANYLGIVILGFFCACFPLLLLFFLTQKQEKKQRVFSMINVAGYNIGCFSLPMITALFGTSAGAIACLFDTGNAIMMTGGSYALTSSLLQISGNQETIWDIIKKFLTSIPFDAYMILLIFMLLHVKIPPELIILTEPFANANAFLAMFMLGLMFEIKVDRTSMKKAVTLLVQRLLFAFCFIFLILKFSPFELTVNQILMVTLFAPISTLAPYYTQRCLGDETLAAFTNSISILVSMVMMSVIRLLIM